MSGDLVAWAGEAARRGWCASHREPDVALHRGCANIMTVFAHCGGGGRFSFGETRARIEDAAVGMARLTANAPEGMRALAEVTWALNYLGFVSFAGITLGAALARNVLIRDGFPLPPFADQPAGAFIKGRE